MKAAMFDGDKEKFPHVREVMNGLVAFYKDAPDQYGNKIENIAYAYRAMLEAEYRAHDGRVSHVNDLPDRVVQMFSQQGRATNARDVGGKSVS